MSAGRGAGRAGRGAGRAGRGAGRGGRGPLGFAGQAARTLIQTGVVGPMRPSVLASVLGTAWRYGFGLPTLLGAAAARYPDRAALIDERETVSYAALRQRVAAVAAALYRDHGVRRRGKLGVLCRNHAGFAVATLAGATVGADLVFLNTDFAGPQLAEVLGRETVATLVHDEEFTAAVDAAGFTGPRILAWTDSAVGRPSLETLAAAGGARPPASREPSRIVMLTSGTTGTPKGAPRDVEPLVLAVPAIGMVDVMRLRSGDPLLVLPPLFHGFGLAYWTLALALGSPLLLCRRFDPDRTLALVAEYRAAALFGVPVMLRRLVALPAEVRNRYDTSSLKAVGAAGAPLPPDLATQFLDTFGEILFNLYGSTETGWSTLATPADLRAAPGTVGVAAQGVTVRVLDADGRPVPTAASGVIHVGSRLTFGGYSGGGGKRVVDGLMSTGDLGHFDPAGRLFIDGREDDMIVSGGENVFPQEVEELLARHAAVADVAVVGVPDQEFGQRLVAYVVLAGPVDADGLREYVKANLARYKVPREVRFVDQLPRNATGKVLKRFLKE